MRRFQRQIFVRPVLSHAVNWSEAGVCGSISMQGRAVLGQQRRAQLLLPVFACFSSRWLHAHHGSGGSASRVVACVLLMDIVDRALDAAMETQRCFA